MSKKRIYPDKLCKADLTPINPTPANTSDGRICNPERIVPGLRQLETFEGNKARRLEAETFAHFAQNAGQAEVDLVAPVALVLYGGSQFLLSEQLRKDLYVVALQEQAHKGRYGDDVIQFVEQELGYSPATLECENWSVGCSNPISIGDIARYVVAEATASGTLFGDHGPLCSYSRRIIEEHRDDELVHNRVATTVNTEVISQASGALLDEYLQALVATIGAASKPDRKWVERVVYRIGYRGVEVERLVDSIVHDPANVDAVLKSCKALFKSVQDVSPQAWGTLAKSLGLQENDQTLVSGGKDPEIPNTNK